MARCTAPKEGHRSASAAANCPACRGGYGRPRSFSYQPYTPSYPTYPPAARSGGGSGRSGGGKTSKTLKPRWSPASSPFYYTPEQVEALTPVRENIERIAERRPDLRDAFLCHAWDDRQGAAKELHDLLVARDISVWFSEKDVILGDLLMRSIDKGLANSKVGVVLVTPALLNRLKKEGIVEKELSVLLRGGRLIPILHGATFDDLNDVSPMLASRSGLDSAEDTMTEIAAKLAEAITLLL